MNQKWDLLIKEIYFDENSQQLSWASAPRWCSIIWYKQFTIWPNHVDYLIDPLAVGAVSFLFPIILNNMDLAIFFVASMSLSEHSIGCRQGRQANCVHLSLWYFRYSERRWIDQLFFRTGLAVHLGLSGESIIRNWLFHVIIWEIPFIFIMIVTKQSDRAGDTFTPMVYTVISVILNNIFDPFLCWFLNGHPRAAVATILAWLCVCVPEWLPFEYRTGTDFVFMISFS
jgi:hypothetical protein